jgi:hypothetical protein
MSDESDAESDDLLVLGRLLRCAGPRERETPDGGRAFANDGSDGTRTRDL